MPYFISIFMVSLCDYEGSNERKKQHLDTGLLGVLSSYYSKLILTQMITSYSECDDMN